MESINAVVPPAEVGEIDVNAMKKEDITKNYKKLTKEQIVQIFQSPDLSSHLLLVIAKLNDSQLQIASSLMTTEHIRLMVPKLQLQQSGVAAQAMNPEQLCTLVDALTHEDRQILNQNISLLTMSNSKEELQNFIGFIDPLAVGIAIQNAELTERIIEACGVLTLEQIKVAVPLLSSKHVREILTLLENEQQLETAISMIHPKVMPELLESFNKEFDVAVASKTSVESSLENIKSKLPELGKRISSLPDLGDNKETEYESIVRSIRTTKQLIENVQQNIRELQAKLKLSKIIPENEIEMLSKYKNLSDDMRVLALDAHSQFSILSANDGLITVLNHKWETIKSKNAAVVEQSRRDAEAPSDMIYIDDDMALVLYETIKTIGNPDAIGNHYEITWDQIIGAGFRESKDFKDRGITNLEQLQNYIKSNK